MKTPERNTKGHLLEYTHTERGTFEGINYDLVTSVGIRSVHEIFLVNVYNNDNLMMN